MRLRVWFTKCEGIYFGEFRLEIVTVSGAGLSKGAKNV